MKKENILIRYLRTASILVFISILYASVLSGQTNDSKEQFLPSKQKISDNPLLRLPADKKNWQPIPSPKFEKRTGKISSSQTRSVIEYDILTKTVNRSEYVQIEAPATMSQSTPQSFGIFDPGEQIETIFTPDNRIKISPTVDFPWRTICKLYITFPDGNHYVGSGVLISLSDSIGFHCLTAAHCVYRAEYGGYASTVEVIPGLDNDYTPFYSAWAAKIKVPEAWTTNSSPEYDWACLTLDRQIGNFTGWMSIYTTPELKWYQRIFHGAGYPTDRDFGLCQYYHSDSGKSADNNILLYKIDATAGQDGMPVWTMDGNTRRIVSIHIGDDDGSGNNYGLLINAEKFNQLDQWIQDDLPPTDHPDLVDDGPKWSNFSPGVAVRGFHKFSVWNDIRNIGTAKSGSLTVAYYASTDAAINASSDFLIGTTKIGSLPAFSWRDSKWIGIFPEAISAGEYYIGWIIDPENRVNEFDETNNTALIVSKKLVVRDPYIEIVTPNGGEVFAIGEQNTIQWITAGGSGNVTLDVTFNNGANWQNLVTNLPDSQYYQWMIPASQPISFCCLIRITDTFKNLTDSSDAIFVVETRPTIPGIPQDEGEFTNKGELLFNWTGSNDAETGIAGYNIQVGTSPGSNDIADTLVTDQMSYVARGSHNQTAYARVRAKNGAGLFSHWSAASNGILIDLTPPIVQGGPVDEGEFSGSDSVLFKWNAAVDEESGVIMNYKLQVGTAIDSSDVFNKWINRKLQYKVAGKHGQTLYARIKVHNAAVGISDWSDWSDGIIIDTTPPGDPSKPYSEGLVVNYIDVPFNWDQASDSISGIIDYRLKVIDLNASNEVIFDEWVGNVTEYLVSAEDGQRLVATVLAKNGAGLVSSESLASEPVQVQQTHIQLALIEYSPTYPSDDWSNAIDNDIIGWDGTVSAFTNHLPKPYAIFGALSGSTFNIDRIKLLTDTGVGYAKRWLTHFRLLYSLSGINEEDFSLLLEADKHGGDLEEYTFPDQKVKYLKLILDNPDQAAEKYAQLGEFQVYGRQEFVQTEKADIVLVSGSTTHPNDDWSNAIDNDIEGWDGTVSAIAVGVVSNAIFAFPDSSVKQITKIRLLSDTGMGFEYRWIKEFKIEISTTGTQEEDFHLVLDGQKSVGGWESYYFVPVEAKYVKINKVLPNGYLSKYVQIGEIEIFTVKSVFKSNFEIVSNFDQGQELISEVEPPQSYNLQQNYPNPFNPETTIRFQIPGEGQVNLKIYNMRGQEITTLVDGQLSAGYHSIMWNGRDNHGKKVPSGMYLYQFRAGKYSVTKKMVLLE